MALGSILKRKRKWPKLKKFELINDILPAIAAKSAQILNKPVPNLAGSITKIMSAVICESTTEWNKESKSVDVAIKIYNYTAFRAYTILATWPKESGGSMKNNEQGGRKEATGVWAWKLETLQPGENITITYSLEGLEKGDWTETDVFFREGQEIIGAMKMDEKYLEEIRNQEKILDELNASNNIEGGDNNDHEVVVESSETISEPVPEPAIKPPSGQSTLFGGEQ